MLNQLWDWVGINAFKEGRENIRAGGRVCNTLLPLLLKEELPYRTKGCWLVCWKVANVCGGREGNALGIEAKYLVLQIARPKG